MEMSPGRARRVRVTSLCVLTAMASARRRRRVEWNGPDDPFLTHGSVSYCVRSGRLVPKVPPVGGARPSLSAPDRSALPPRSLGDVGDHDCRGGKRIIAPNGHVDPHRSELAAESMEVVELSAEQFDGALTATRRCMRWTNQAVRRVGQFHRA